MLILSNIKYASKVMLNTFYKRYSKNVNEKNSVKVLYLATVGNCLVGVLISFLVIRVESALDIWWNLAGIFSGGMLGLFLLGYFSQRVTTLPVLLGVAIGLLVIMWMSLSPSYFTGALEAYKNPFHSYLTIIVGTLVIFFTGFLASLFLSPNNRN